MKKEETPSFISLKLPQLLRYALFSIAVAYLVIYLWMVYYRIRYPFDLEWIEGGMVNQVQRLMHGQSMYVAPSINYVPFLYPPVYFYFSALASLIFGTGLFPLRLVSFLASLVSFTTIFLIVRAETKNGWAAILIHRFICSSFSCDRRLAGYCQGGLAFSGFMVVIHIFRQGQEISGVCRAGRLTGCAGIPDQTDRPDRMCARSGLPLLVQLEICADLPCRGNPDHWHNHPGDEPRQRRLVQLLCFWAALAANGMAAAGIYYLLERRPAGPFTACDPFRHILPGRPAKAGSTLLFQWLSILTGALAGSFITRVKIGGYDNVLLPAYAVLSILFGLGLGGLLQLIKQLPDDYQGQVGGIDPGCLPDPTGDTTLQSICPDSNQGRPAGGQPAGQNSFRSERDGLSPRSQFFAGPGRQGDLCQQFRHLGCFTGETADNRQGTCWRQISLMRSASRASMR